MQYIIISILGMAFSVVSAFQDQFIPAGVVFAISVALYLASRDAYSATHREGVATFNYIEALKGSVLATELAAIASRGGFTDKDVAISVQVSSKDVDATKVGVSARLCIAPQTKVGQDCLNEAVRKHPALAELHASPGIEQPRAAVRTR